MLYSWQPFRPADTNSNLTIATDLAYKQVTASSGGPYIMSVSPWQFKNLGGSDNWVELSDTLWDYRWRQAINDFQPDIIDIVSWNNYAESHYIGDVNPKVDLGNLAPLYVNGFDHAPWRIAAQHFIQWYKTCSEPVISTDQVVFWYRTRPKSATCSTGDRPRNADYPVDSVFAMVLLGSPATVSLDLGSSHVRFNAGTGVTMGSVPFAAGNSQTPQVQIIRGAQTVLEVRGSPAITNDCNYYNFNPWVGLLDATTSDSALTDKHTSTAVIVGGTVAGVASALLLLILIFWIWRR